MDTKALRTHYAHTVRGFFATLALSITLPATAQDIVISGVIDGPLSGGVPKAVELYVINNIDDLSAYGVSSANNGNGATGAPELTLSGSASAGDYLYIASNIAGFNDFFDFDPNFTSAAASINGDDAIELFENGVVIDVFGDVDTDGSGTGWDYLDGWAYRNNDSGPDGSTFVLANWTYSGSNALDGASSNTTADTPFPIGSYTAGGNNDLAPTVTRTEPQDGANNVAVDAAIVIDFSEAVTATDNAFRINCKLGGTISTNISGGPKSFTLTPNNDLTAEDNCQVTVAADQVSDQDGDPDNMTADFSLAFATAVPIGSCGDSATLISAIQGSGDTSPLEGDIVTIEGVVVADYQETNLGIFAVQEEDINQDGDPLSSEGIFVFSDTPVEIGDVVRVNGEVVEFFGLTELTNVNNIAVCREVPEVTEVTPALLTLPLPATDFPEQLEGMLVDFGDGLTVTETFNQARFGELLLSNGRLFQPTHQALPGAEANAIATANTLNQILIDDAQNGQNPDPLINPDGSAFGANNTVRAGSLVTGTAVMHFSFGSYRLQAVDIAIVDTNPRSDTAAEVGGSLTVAAFNVLNYFTTLDTGANICGPSLLGCRGADSASELQRQRDKIIAALQAIDADIVGLIELENNANESLQDLIDSLGGDYAFLDTGTIGSDAIKVGFIYKPAAVQPVGPFAVLDSSVDPIFLDSKNRPALAQTFEELANGERLTIAVNHFKSKGSPCDDVGDPGTGDGQGNCNLTRTDAATALANWLASDPTTSDDPDFMIIGDLNAYKMEDPIAALQDAGYNDLIADLLGPDAYSFVFSGQFGYLDYALANDSLAEQVSGITEWHINADEPRAIDYNEEFKSPSQVDLFYNADPFRASDHDPVIVGLELGSTGGEQTVCAALGDNRRRPWPDQDQFSFTGEVGEAITVTLAADPDGSSSGERATLILYDSIRSAYFFRYNGGALPNTITATLPASGRYRVYVAERPRFFFGREFRGDYCLTLQSSAGAADTLAPTRSVEQ